MSAALRRAPAPALLCCGLAAAAVLRSGIAGGDGGRSLPAGAAFALALLALAVAAGWRPGRPSLAAAGVGLAGALLLLAGPLLMHLRTLPLQAGSPAGDLASWAGVVVVIACAEEALLRGALMGALLRWGIWPSVAAGVAAVAFALPHVPLYGWQAVPLDLGVGVWLGGLRLWSGGFGAPAVAHSVADLASWWLR